MSAQMPQSRHITAWLEELRGLIGRTAEIRIKDTAGSDPAAPAKHFTLHDVKVSPEQTHLICYLNAGRHVSIPVTKETTANGSDNGYRLRSVDESAQLIYELHVHL